MDFKTIKNYNGGNEATMLLYGTIGDKVDGDYMAYEIAWLQEQGCTLLNLHINSDGGLVTQGLSVVNALLNFKGETRTFIDGIAASMAGVIAMCGKTVSMNDFARLMVHNPSFGNKQNLSDKEKNALAHIGDMLNTILSRRGIDANKMAKWMEAETWIDANTAKEHGLIDNIISTGKAQQYANYDIKAIMNLYNKNESNMKNVFAKLGLTAEATEVEAVTAVEALQNKQTVLQTEYTALQAQNAALLAKVSDMNKAKVTAMVDNAIAKGQIKKDTREEVIAFGIEAPEKLELIINAVVPVKGSIIGQIGGDNTNADKTFDWMQKNDPKGLEKLRNEQPEAFKALLDVYLNS